MAINGHQRLDDEGYEAQILLRRLARSMQQHTVIGTQAPVVVFSASVDAIEGFFMQEHTETVVAGHTFHQRHE